MKNSNGGGGDGGGVDSKLGGKAGSRGDFGGGSSITSASKDVAGKRSKNGRFLVSATSLLEDTEDYLSHDPPTSSNQQNSKVLSLFTVKFDYLMFRVVVTRDLQ